MKNIFKYFFIINIILTINKNLYTAQFFFQQKKSDSINQVFGNKYFVKNILSYAQKLANEALIEYSGISKKFISPCVPHSIDNLIIDNKTNIELKKILLRNNNAYFLNLKKLIIKNSLITDKLIKDILKLHPQLTTLSLINCDGTDNLEINSPNLVSLSLVGCNFLTLHITTNSKITNINLSYTRINDKDLNTIIKECPNLTKIKLIQCRNLINPKIISTNLRRLDIRNCLYLIKPKIICPKLNFFYLDAYSISSVFLDIIINKCKNLKLFYLSSTTIDTHTLNNLIQSCPKLEYLFLINCIFLENITIKNLENLLELRLNFSKCKNIEVINCPKIELVDIQSSICANLDQLIDTFGKLLIC